MKKFAKLISATLAGIMLVSMIGCGGSKGGSTSGESTGTGGDGDSSAAIATAVDDKLTWATNADFEP